MEKHSILISFLLLAVIALSVFGYTSLLEQYTEILDSINQQDILLSTIQSDNDTLRQELMNLKEQGSRLLRTRASLKDKLLASQKERSELSLALGGLVNIDQKLAEEISWLKQDNYTLTAGLQTLNAEFAELLQENDGFQEALNSIPELEKAIRGIRRQRPLLR